jgi:hypothetical protein
MVNRQAEAGKMGFLIGVIGLAVGAIGFWLDFSADPFAAAHHAQAISYYGIGVSGIFAAIIGFILQLWSPKLRLRALSRYGAANKV